MPDGERPRPRSALHRSIFGPDAAAEIDAELAFHLEQRAAELVSGGVPPERAREMARARFGDLDQARRQCLDVARRRTRRMARLESLTALRQDLVFALRSLAKQPAFTLVAVLTLALGIGADSAIFSVVRAVLLAPLPYAEPERLVEVRTAYPNGKDYTLSAPDFASVAELDGPFSGVTAYYSTEVTWTGEGEPTTLQATVVGRDFFALLGVAPALGRDFTVDEHVAGRERVVVLSHALWQSRFGGRADALGRTLTFAGVPHEVVGVAPEGFAMPLGAEVYGPLPYDETFSAAAGDGRRSEFLTVVARLAPGATVERARVELAALGERLQREFPDTNGRLTFTAYRVVDQVVGDVRTPLLVLLGAVGLVLLIACVNVANLLLARGATRQGEMAVRHALGAGRGRLVRQLLTEAAVLGLAGGAIGLGLAWAGTRALVAGGPQGIPRLDEVGVDRVVVAVTFVLALGTALLFGLLPALESTRGRLAGALKESGRGTPAGGGRGRGRLRYGLIVTETALAVVLLVGAGLLLRSFLGLTAVDPGFEPEGAITFEVSLQGAGYDDFSHRVTTFRELEERIAALPGVAAVGGANVLPLHQGGAIESFDVEGREPRPDELLEIRTVWATPGYLAAIGTPLLAGRSFGDEDREGSAPVVLVNRAAVERWFDGESPLGRRLQLRGESREVVGVVGDLPQLGLDRPAEPVAYYPYAQLPGRTLAMVVRSASGDPLALAGDVRRLVRRVDPELPVAEPQPLSSLVDGSLAPARFYAALLGLFAAVALALALVGIFGVMSYAVAQRTREIGIRIALGARRGEVLGMVLRRALLVAGAGLLAGALVALAATRVMASQLFGVSATDPWTFAAVLVLLAASAAAASLVPARRAASIDPMLALRAD
ncbi:MAG TPA: ABC transporter permease [Thermoanaerobaculia bacterium]|nr:ABC transporter permease [Thermoanaerobaculia bacterium]